MMNKPPLNELQSKVGCRYMLVTVVAKRARQLVGNEERLQNRKAVSYAVDELYEDKLCELMEAPELREQMAEKALTALREFSKENVAVKWYGVME